MFGKENAKDSNINLKYQRRNKRVTLYYAYRNFSYEISGRFKNCQTTS